MILGMLITALQFWESSFLFDAFMPRKKFHSNFYIYLLCTILIFSIIYVLLFPVPSGLSIISSILLFLAFNYLLYTDHWHNRILIALSWYALLVTTESFIASFILFITNKITLPVDQNQFVFMVAACEFLVFFSLSRLLLRLNVSATKSHTPFTFLFYWCSIAIACILAFSILSGTVISPSFTSACITFVVIASILFVKKSQINAQAQKESLALNERLKSESESVEILSSAYAKQRKMTHDYNAHLQTLSILLEQNDILQAKTYLHQLTQNQNERILFVNTHHAVLDAIFNQKATIAQKSKIDLQFHFNNLHDVIIPACDLAVVIGNLMDNAIEACNSLPEENRFIEVRTLLDENFIFSIRNRSLPVTIVDDRIETTKSDPELHGFGLINIESILSYYPDSFHTMDYQDGWFCYTFELPNTSRQIE